MSWAGAEAHADKRPFLLARAKALAAIRAWFADEGFIEADVGALVPTPGAEVHVAAFETDGRYLHTSPEFAMKGLLAAGETKIFRLGAAYRKGERGALHAPEFTLLEWYRAGAPYEEVMADCAEIARTAARAIGTEAMRWKERSADVFAAPETITVREAFSKFAPLPPRGEGREGGRSTAADETEGSDAARESSSASSHSARPLPLPPPPGAGVTSSDMFSAVMVEKIEPHLGLGAIAFLTEYPIEEAALAQPCAHDPSVAERFEMYACGVELANGYGELTDVAEQKRRFKAAMDEKQKRYGERWPEPLAFYDALAHMPAASGCALGVDRLIMLLSGARRIEDVLWSAP